MTKWIGYPQGNKAMYLERMRAHRAADTLVRGAVWQNGRNAARSAASAAWSAESAAEITRQADDLIELLAAAR